MARGRVAGSSTVVRAPRRPQGLADPRRAGGSVWARAGGISRAKLSSASSASRKSKGASPAEATAVPQTLPPPSRREPHRRLRPGRRETRRPAPLRRWAAHGRALSRPPRDARPSSAAPRAAHGRAPAPAAVSAQAGFLYGKNTNSKCIVPVVRC